MTTPNKSLLDWLDDLCVRFIVNLPHEELQSVERICFQIEEAQWFYEDFIRPLDPANLPSMNLRSFSQRMFAHCPLFAGFTQDHFLEAFNHFLNYKTRVPVRGAIMLNQDMTHAVLVKGWKKGAKWSFPRGKINKDEPDLECAIREVYEETGYDLKEAGLVLPENEMKSISITMREQSMLLYVFRGVPMDTYFEPRTRKEISKIDWYKLTDLPTIKRKNPNQQGTGQDLIKDNSFYMVAPFLGPLKAWIKTQRRLDRQRVQPGSHLAPQPAAGITDTEGLEADLGETTADEAAMPPAQSQDANFAALVANLGRSHRPSDQLPEVSAHADPAAELKRLLSVGIGFPPQPQPVEAPQSVHEPPHNPLLAMLHGNNGPASAPNTLPRTPFDQILPTPQLPQSPHGQHHPRPMHLDQMQPPPPFGFHQQQTGHPLNHQHPHVGHQHHNGFPPGPNQFMQPPPPRHADPSFPPHMLNAQQPFGTSVPLSYMQTGDSQSTQPLQHSGVTGPAAPPASKLPAPKLNAHTLGLLNAFKINEKPANSSPVAQAQPLAQSSQATPIATRPPPVQNIRSSAPSPPAFQSPPPVDNFEPVQPKPRNAHQDNLLSLFRSPSMAAAMPAVAKTPELPVELSAHPLTPGIVKMGPATEAGPPVPDMNAKPNLLHAFGIQQNPNLTSATVRGPVNAPDFDTVRKNAILPSNGTSRGPSPFQTRPEQKMFVPQQILRREGSVPRPAVSTAEQNKSANASPAPIPATAPFKPQILKRTQQPASQGPATDASAHAQGLLSLFKPQQNSPQPPTVSAQAPPSRSPVPAAAPAHAQGLLNLFKQASPQPQPIQTTAPLAHSPAPPAQIPSSFDSKSSAPIDQKNTLLSLFGKSGAPMTASPAPASPSPLLPVATNPAPLARSSQPPTPKMYMSGVISPVSPLPGSQVDSPAQANSRSRISSIGDSMPPSFMVPQPSAPTSHPHALAAQQSNGFGAPPNGGMVGSPSVNLPELGLAIDKDKMRVGAETADKSPVNKTYLLSFLNDVARKGR